MITDDTSRAPAQDVWRNRCRGGCHFTAHAGEIFGLLGPNGAGKTTTIGCISGLLMPTAGRILVDNHDVVREGTAARRSLGVVPQELAMYDDLNAIENLEYWGGAQGLRGSELKQRIARVLELTGLQDRAKEGRQTLFGRHETPAQLCLRIGAPTQNSIA